ncbi:hypothetical protein AAFF_G00223920 [Aldrovandia affinis]|uniref:Uncharacterized protein n=1 Tax=Aldrovandia affinis TaxID=143900 RepID=A0AAD7TAU0_9TELE|nr:hypothetical protein AAFF_G00223920 [Aldrovandia affinis]
MHPSVSFGGDQKKKPDTVTHYNKTKAGVDVLDHMARLHSVNAAGLSRCFTTCWTWLPSTHIVYRSGRKVRKTRKYDIITTPAERVEMAPLNEEMDDEEDSTLFDVKYR